MVPDPRKYVHVGQVVKAHGIKGELKIAPFADDPADFTYYSQLILIGPGDDIQHEFKVIGCRPQARHVLVTLAGSNDRLSAEVLVGAAVWVPKEFLPPLAEDEFYWHDMVGLSVTTENGRSLGRVKSLFTAGPGGHDVLVVRGTGREYLIPARREFIVSMDSMAGILVVADVPGLFD
ncbi:MAG: ribosome maturation factor RimM [Proteobacteria bacterium]|nr:ribosome maturation factor RimM [Pseudomonadota bacterium]MBU1687272.1 ribosome maturation factor RimM [Pseudomonadota bacterium]